MDGVRTAGPGLRLSGAWQLKCEFCGSTVLPGAKLCSACRSALKRARHEPSSVLQPLVKRASDTLQRRRSRKDRDADADAKSAAMIPPPVDTRRGRTPAFVGALAVAVCIVGYVILQHRDDGARADPSLPAITQPAGVAAGVEHAPPPIAPLAEPVPPVIDPIPEIPKPRHFRVKAPPPVISPLPLHPAPAVQPVAPPVAVLPAPQPPDRKTKLRNAFNACASTDVLAQAFCEQRARNELCDGLWGAVPQCPPQRDYGS